MYSGRRRAEVSAEVLVHGNLAVSSQPIGDQSLVAGGVLAVDDDRLADGRVLRQRGFDLAEFDAEAADLDLVVDAAEALDRAVGAIAREVAGAIHALGRPAAEAVEPGSVRRSGPARAR